MNLLKRSLKFVAESLVQNGLTSIGSEVGTAIGKRIGAKIYVEPEPVEEKETETKKP